MKWIVPLLLALVLAVVSVAAGDEEESIPHLRQDKEPAVNRRTSGIFQIFSNTAHYYRHPSYHRGYHGKKIRDKGGEYCSGHHRCDECEGDCDKDSDCRSGLYCYHRKPYQSVPGCYGASRSSSRTDFCVKKKHSSSSTSTDTKSKSYSDKSSNKIRDKGSKYCTSKHPCKECYGDCDDDHDCKSGLYCFHRKPYQSVPGCSGGSSSSSRTDFCVKKKHSDSTSADTKSTSTDTHSDKSSNKIRDKGEHYCTHKNPCKECYGDCDDDDDCEGSLVCYHRNKPYKSVPGCSGGSKAKSRTDFCVKKKYGSGTKSSTDTKSKSSTDTDSSDHKKVKYGSKDYCTERHPCDRCEGDCDKDSHCKGSLICYHRDSKDDYLPGCSGEHKYGADFCIRREDKDRL